MNTTTAVALMVPSDTDTVGADGMLINVDNLKIIMFIAALCKIRCNLNFLRSVSLARDVRMEKPRLSVLIPLQ